MRRLSVHSQSAASASSACTIGSPAFTNHSAPGDPPDFEEIDELGGPIGSFDPELDLSRRLKPFLSPAGEMQAVRELFGVPRRHAPRDHQRPSHRRRASSRIALRLACHGGR